MPSSHAVLFDVDGVLVDSLGEHLRYCQDKADEFGLDLTIPDPETFKNRYIRKRVQVSPMHQFFRALGFPEIILGRATRDYESDFISAYCPPIFAGMRETVLRIAAAQVPLGIVSFNVQKNVEKSLGYLTNCFNEKIVFAKEQLTESSKTGALLAAARELGVPHQNCMYVGDQRRDWEAARDAGCPFIGVAFGWEISMADNEFPVVCSPSELCDALLTFVGSMGGRGPSPIAKAEIASTKKNIVMAP